VKPAMSLALPVEFQTLLDSGRALIGDLGFWWEIGVLLLAAAGRCWCTAR